MEVHEAVPHEVLWKFVGAADVGIVMISPVSKSYYYALPNKLFECIQSGIPVVGSDLPEIKRIVNGHKVGTIAKPDDSDSIASAVKELINSELMYNEAKHNVENSKKILCWESEKIALSKAFNEILQEL